MEDALAADLASDDSITADYARRFLKGFEGVFRAYKPNKTIVKKLQPLVSGLNIKVIGGNWCSDTRREVPALSKVLYYCGVPADSFSYYRVDKKKKAIDRDFAFDNAVTHVPTVYVYRHGKLLGTIVEKPAKSWEADLLKLL